MKKLFIIISFIVYGFILNAQTYETIYTYDDAGNRISRSTIIIEKIISNKNVSSVEFEDTFMEGKIIVSPNPTKGSLYVSFIDLKNSEEVIIELYNISGRHIKTIEASSNRTEVNFTSEASGTYIIKINLGNVIKEYVIIKK